MPRTDTVTPPGCPPLRALTFDNLGLIKVLENPADSGQLQVVARWGEPDPQRSVVGVSLSVDENVVLAVARKNQTVEILDPSSGKYLAEINLLEPTANKLATLSRSSKQTVSLVGVHLSRGDFTGKRSLLTCTEEGYATSQRICLEEAELDGSHDDGFAEVQQTFTVCKGGNILCFKVDRSERYSAFGGDGADLNLWDLERSSKIWEAKAPRRDSLGLMSPPFVTASAFLGKDHRKIVIGTGHHQIRLYDISAQRRPVLSVDFLESPIKVVETDTDDYTIFVGTGNGDMATFDMRTGKLLGSFKGRCSGSIRSISRHSSQDIIASCGLDRYLRIYNIKTRQLLTRVFLKQQLVAVVFDENYPSVSPSVRGSLDVEGEAKLAEKDDECNLQDTKSGKSKKSKKRAKALAEAQCSFEKQEKEESLDAAECKDVQLLKERKRKKKGKRDLEVNGECNPQVSGDDVCKKAQEKEKIHKHKKKKKVVVSSEG